MFNHLTGPRRHDHSASSHGMRRWNRNKDESLGLVCLFSLSGLTANVIVLAPTVVVQAVARHEALLLALAIICGVIVAFGGRDA